VCYNQDGHVCFDHRDVSNDNIARGRGSMHHRNVHHKWDFRDHEVPEATMYRQVLSQHLGFCLHSKGLFLFVRLDNKCWQIPFGRDPTECIDSRLCPFPPEVRLEGLPDQIGEKLTPLKLPPRRPFGTLTVDERARLHKKLDLSTVSPVRKPLFFVPQPRRRSEVTLASQLPRTKPCARPKSANARTNVTTPCVPTKIAQSKLMQPAKAKNSTNEPATTQTPDKSMQRPATKVPEQRIILQRTASSPSIIRGGLSKLREPQVRKDAEGGELRAKKICMASKLREPQVRNHVNHLRADSTGRIKNMLSSTAPTTPTERVKKSPSKQAAVLINFDSLASRTKSESPSLKILAEKQMRLLRQLSGEEGEMRGS